jgi:hypothetical protein
MKAINKFETFLDDDIVKKQTPDRSRANFLLIESEKSFRGLKKRVRSIGIDSDNSNSIIKDCYDILMELIRAKMLLEGYNASGKGAHEAEVAYTRKIGFKEKEVQFLNQIRYFRNGMIYYGKIMDEEYAKKVVDFTKNIYPNLKENIGAAL